MKFQKKTGFTMIPNEIIDSHKLNGKEKLVLLIIARFLPKSFPSVSKISQLAGICPRLVRTNIKSLRDKNVLIVRERPGYSSIYTPYWADDTPTRPLSSGAHPPCTGDEGYPCPPVPTNNTPSNKNYLTRGKEHDFQSVHPEVKTRIRNMAKLKSIPD